MRTYTALAALVISTAAALAQESGPEVVKAYMLEHGQRMLENSIAMHGAADEYYKLIKNHNGNYEALWSTESSQVTDLLSKLKKHFLLSHNNYEEIEGIVAGIPSLAVYDLILDAGVPGSEDPKDVAPYNLVLPNGQVWERPGNLYHYLIEPTLWGTIPEYVAKEADLNGNGKRELGEVLPKADLLFAFTKAHVEWTQKMLEDVRTWTPNIDDVFTAMITMVPTVGDYFEEWKNSHFITGELPMFVAQSRLVDVKGIMRSTKVMYFTAGGEPVEKIDPMLHQRIQTTFLELLDFVDSVYMKEQAGHSFTPEEADALASEAQDIADRIVAMLAQAAKKLNLQLSL